MSQPTDAGLQRQRIMQLVVMAAGPSVSGHAAAHRYDENAECTVRFAVVGSFSVLHGEDRISPATNRKTINDQPSRGQPQGAAQT